MKKKSCKAVAEIPRNSPLRQKRTTGAAPPARGRVTSISSVDRPALAGNLDRDYPATGRMPSDGGYLSLSPAKRRQWRPGTRFPPHAPDGGPTPPFYSKPSLPWPPKSYALPSGRAGPAVMAKAVVRPVLKGSRSGRRRTATSLRTRDTDACQIFRFAH